MVKARKSLYAVHHILDKKQEKGKTQYLIRWKGYGPKDDTWEPAENLAKVHNLIEDFEKKLQPPPQTPPPKHKPSQKSTEHHADVPVPVSPAHPTAIQGALGIDEIEHLSNIMWRPVQRKFICSVHFKPRVTGLHVNPSVETLEDVRYRCPQLLIDLLLASLKPNPQ